MPESNETGCKIRILYFAAIFLMEVYHEKI